MLYLDFPKIVSISCLTIGKIQGEMKQSTKIAFEMCLKNVPKKITVISHVIL